MKSLKIQVQEEPWSQVSRYVRHELPYELRERVRFQLRNHEISYQALEETLEQVTDEIS